MDYNKVIQLANDISQDLTVIRQKIHENPELSWQEIETSKIIENEMKNLGMKNVRRGFKGTGSGVIADLEGSKKGPCIALRADIDALPINEQNNLPYKSKNEGVMHACGHDAHTAIMIGVARILSKIKDEIKGSIRFIFQPAEEAGMDSGAPVMIAEGALDNVDAIAGLHVWASEPAGKFGVKAGPCMASADCWEITIKGQGGHGAMPHLAIDPTVAAAQIISMLQTIVSREIDPLESTVVSVGKVESGNAMNVIPDKAVISGNVRTTKKETRDTMEDRFNRIVNGISSALNCKTAIDYNQIYPVTVNDPILTDILKQSASQVLGDDNLKNIEIAMGSEDFSYYGEKIPAVFGFLGIGDPDKGTDKAHHSPLFNANDSVLASGSAILSLFALNYLENCK